MITKEQLLNSMRHETRVIQHLATKVPEGAYDYRPAEGQRSTLELMQYMTRMAAEAAIGAVNGNWDHAGAMNDDMEKVTPENFAGEMDRQIAIIEDLLAGVDESAATTADAVMPWGTPTTLSAALLDMPLKCYVAYRMQFFLYCKAAGIPDLTSAQCWVGAE